MRDEAEDKRERRWQRNRAKNRQTLAECEVNPGTASAVAEATDHEVEEDEALAEAAAEEQGIIMATTWTKLAEEPIWGTIQEAQVVQKILHEKFDVDHEEIKSMDGC